VIPSPPGTDVGVGSSSDGEAGSPAEQAAREKADEEKNFRRAEPSGADPGKEGLPLPEEKVGWISSLKPAAAASPREEGSACANLKTSQPEETLWVRVVRSHWAAAATPGRPEFRADGKLIQPRPGPEAGSEIPGGLLGQTDGCGTPSSETSLSRLQQFSHGQSAVRPAIGCHFQTDSDL
jgi:hypothetical protein